MSLTEVSVNHDKPSAALPSWLIALLRYILAGTLPVFLVLTGVRLVTTEAFLQLEYHRPGFPEDRFGFSQEDRLHYAPYAVEYLRNDAGIAYLGDLAFENGEPLFRARELGHMEDVKVVMRAAMRVHTVLTLVLAAIVLILAWRRETRAELRAGLIAGGALTITIIVTLVILIFASWDFFFDGFHGLFFEGDSWQFSTSDTLIRLFPEQFWFDAAMSIGLFTVVGAFAAILIAFTWDRRSSPAPDLNQNGAVADPAHERDSSA
ncbi:MAG: TIGR01906 family membrane protein [Chloroflexi bacterium]|nr:MAG: TIGR01906 family membrane protein [Chloroflexota bacterium]